MDGLTRLGVQELLEHFRARRVSPVELLDAVRRRIEDVERRVGGFVWLDG